MAANEPVITKEEISALSEESGLSIEQLNAALLEACGARPKEIAYKMGKGEKYVYQLRYSNDNYREVVRELHSLIASRIVGGAEDINSLFNSQIGPSVRTLMDIRDDLFAKDENRIKASLAFLDRAPDAPKATQNRESKSVTLSFPVTAMKNMRDALKESGMEEELGLLDLIEGGDEG